MSYTRRPYIYDGEQLGADWVANPDDPSSGYIRVEKGTIRINIAFNYGGLSLEDAQAFHTALGEAICEVGGETLESLMSWAHSRNCYLHPRPEGGWFINLGDGFITIGSGPTLLDALKAAKNKLESQAKEGR